MSDQHKEIAFESAIEKYMLDRGGFISVDKDNFDPERCIDPKTLHSFIQETQSTEWEYLKNIQKEKAEQISAGL
ncbi:MAG: hypothetical protein A2161_07970 [Candidatus Schekmanbacteria bacterium RBG_13_48_7]|uniref:Uncharacterized protein n=1 Tax=Candidatus Schekmanbacteria bacterium RBG_13_48_7 TaxID=1817878 RepID=A0A1F7S1D5_9BACT|nr:MAG: hypothetical protein A2161_07970 [Candidatus Schekmanbacteria bacterium RBG_13_48_7]